MMTLNLKANQFHRGLMQDRTETDDDTRDAKAAAQWPAYRRLLQFAGGPIAADGIALIGEAARAERPR